MCALYQQSSLIIFVNAVEVYIYIKEIKTMTKWECAVCGYIYDPEKGDGINGIDPGTPFEDLPDDWVCPACGAGKDSFEKVE